jgi:[NiFe] hydrogenase diaphorase moiety large subunit
VALNDMHAEGVAGIVDRVVAHYRRDSNNMLQILREVQEACDWIPPEAIDRLQAVLGVPRTKIEGVAGFYSFLYTQPRGKYRILFSDNVTDNMQGNRALMERLCSSLWVEPGKVSEDGLLSIDKTSCTGMCDQGPAMLVNNRAITRLTAARIDEIAELVRNKCRSLNGPPTSSRLKTISARPTSCWFAPATGRCPACRACPGAERWPDVVEYAFLARRFAVRHRRAGGDAR